MKKMMSGTLTAMACILFLLANGLHAEERVKIQSGDSIAFLGDSITAQGWSNSAGYVQLVVSGLKANGIDVKPFPAGIGGHKSNQMLARLQKDVLSKKPTWMTLSCGVNDVWHGKNGVPLDKYKENITKIVDEAQAAGVKVMILTSTMIREDAKNTPNKQLEPYNAFLRTLASEKQCLLADLNADMQKQLAELPASKTNRLTVDGVHMNYLGNMMMASGVLRTFGLNDAQIAKAHEDWLVSTQYKVMIPFEIPLGKYIELEKVASSQKKTVIQLFAPELQKAMDMAISDLKK